LRKEKAREGVKERCPAMTTEAVSLLVIFYPEKEKL
jgi:hypothetical protein